MGLKLLDTFTSYLKKKCAKLIFNKMLVFDRLNV